jgi:hypothetical protein
VLLDGRSHTLYWREDVGTLRIQVDAKTCLIEQENDPYVSLPSSLPSPRLVGLYQVADFYLRVSISTPQYSAPIAFARKDRQVPRRQRRSRQRWRGLRRDRGHEDDHAAHRPGGWTRSGSSSLFFSRKLE